MSFNWLSLLSTVVSVVFAVIVLRRYVYRRGTHLLFWGLGLLWYAVGTFAEFYLSLRWSATWMHLWYLGGALLTAAWLGQGTIFLLVRKPQWLAPGLAVLLIVASVYVMFRTFATPLDAAAFTPARAVSDQYKEIFPAGGVRLLTIPFNIYGTLGLVGGAVYSAWLFWRKRVLPNRVVGNILIAVGGLSPAFGGTFTRLGHPEFLYISELLGAIIMFAGFLAVMTTRPAESKAPVAQPAMQ